jgi:hypothetical protein
MSVQLLTALLTNVITGRSLMQCTVYIQEGYHQSASLGAIVASGSVARCQPNANQHNRASQVSYTVMSYKGLPRQEHAQLQHTIMHSLRAS